MAKKDEEEFAKLVKSLSDGGRGTGGLATKSDARHSRDVLGPLRAFSHLTVPVLAASSFLCLLHSFWISAIVSGALGAAIVLFYLYTYYYWMKTEPDRLQTESYRLDERRLGLIAEKSIPLNVSLITESEPESEEPPLVPKPQRGLGQKSQRAIAAPIVDVPLEQDEREANPTGKSADTFERPSRRRETKKKSGED